jgi:hypothetical protein
MSLRLIIWLCSYITLTHIEVYSHNITEILFKVALNTINQPYCGEVSCIILVHVIKYKIMTVVKVYTDITASIEAILIGQAVILVIKHVETFKTAIIISLVMVKCVWCRDDSSYFKMGPLHRIGIFFFTKLGNFVMGHFKKIRIRYFKCLGLLRLQWL